MKKYWRIFTMFILLDATAVAMNYIPTRVDHMADQIYQQYVPKLEQGENVEYVIAQINLILFKYETQRFQELVKRCFVTRYATKLAHRKPESILFIDQDKIKEKCIRYRNGTQKTIEDPTQYKRVMLTVKSPWPRLSFEELLRKYAETI